MTQSETEKEKRQKTFFFILGAVAILVATYFYVKEIKSADYAED